MVTKTAVIFTFPDAIKIWAIPPLLPQPPDFSVDHYLPHLTPPLFVIPFPDDFVLLPENHCRGTISSWYSGFSQPLYFDMLRTEDQYNTQDSKSQRVQIMLNLKPDLSTASLHVNTSEVTPHDFDDAFFQDWRICEDTLFTCWQNENYYQSGIYTQLTSVRFDNVVSHAGPVVKMSPPGNRREYRLFSCPASGRYVNVNSNRTISVLDFLWYILIICRGYISSNTNLRDAARFYRLFLQWFIQLHKLVSENKRTSGSRFPFEHHKSSSISSTGPTFYQLDKSLNYLLLRSTMLLLIFFHRDEWAFFSETALTFKGETPHLTQISWLD